MAKAKSPLPHAVPAAGQTFGGPGAETPVARDAESSPGIRRRTFLEKLAASGGAVLAISAGEIGATCPKARAAEPLSFSWQAPERILDVNVYISTWPFRRLGYAEVDQLVAKLRSYGVVQAWAGSFDALFHRDLRAVNDRLVNECRRTAEFLIPFPCVNPKLPDWEEDLRRVAEEYRAPGIRLHPDYHGYTLDDADFRALLQKASEASLIVQLVLMMEDERTIHPAVKVPMIDPRPLSDTLSLIKGLRLVLLNAQRVTPLPILAKIAATGSVYVDISWQEGVAGVATLLEHVPYERVLFGSYFPRFYFLSTFLKLRESALEGHVLTALAEVNARRLLVEKP